MLFAYMLVIGRIFKLLLLFLLNLPKLTLFHFSYAMMLFIIIYPKCVLFISFSISFGNDNFQGATFI